MIGFIIFVIIAVAVLIYFMRPVVPISSWHHHFSDFQFSAQDFYTQVEDEIKRRQVPETSFSKVTFSQTGILSARREYLRVSWREFVFDICAAPYGTAFFTSWWFAERPEDIISKIPVVNILLGKSRKYKTRYQIDTETMFRSAVHSAVLAIVDSMTEGKGIRLTELDRQYK